MDTPSKNNGELSGTSKDSLNQNDKTNSKKSHQEYDKKKLASDSIEEEQIKILSKKLSKHKGKNPLYFDVYDSEKEIKLSLISEKNKVSITRDLLKTLEENKLHYKLNWFKKFISYKK